MILPGLEGRDWRAGSTTGSPPVSNKPKISWRSPPASPVGKRTCKQRVAKSIPHSVGSAASGEVAERLKAAVC